MSAWTEDRVTCLRALWPQGHSATWIAAELGGGLSRNAVLAKVWRLGLSAGRETLVAQSPGRARRVPATVAVETPPDTGGVSILSVRRNECRWPYGDPRNPGFSLCGCRISRGAYCGPHAAVAYRSGDQSLEGLIRWAGVA